MGYLEKGFTQIYKALYGDAMLVSLGRGTNVAARNQQKDLSLSVTTNVQIHKELIKIKVIFIKSFPGHQLNAISCKSLEIQVSSIAKRKTLSNRRFV